jgi:hypothetical protein
MIDPFAVIGVLLLAAALGAVMGAALVGRRP